ncbi:MAG: flippase-like domain-containing protein [Lachnospiraceae bacterium]|nr:flippase-like domain-containing protein [Lachnospiraceae bacterium]
MNRKNIISAVIFILLAALTFNAIFKGNDMSAVVSAMSTLHPAYFTAAMATAFFFVSAEGFMISYLLRSLNYKTSTATCVKYSFVGFFFSGITPSATGGQPMQLYYMNKEGHKVSDSTVVLMTVAVIYKLVLVVMGVGILIFCYKPLADYLKGYLYLYYLGLFLNTLLVVVLLFIMISPKCFKGIVIGGEKLLKKFRILKKSKRRTEKLIDMADQYHEAVLFFLKNKGKIVTVFIFTVIQRCSVFFLTWLIYKGMGLEGSTAFTVMSLQASIYIAVDMLPLPGAQGITEIMYKTAFSQIFPGACLTASMCITRGLNFYLVLIASALVAAWCHFRSKVRVS